MGRLHGQRLCLRGSDAGARTGGADNSLARNIPRQGLAVYLEFKGLDAQPAAWKSSAAYKLLNKTKLGALLEDMVLQACDLRQKSRPIQGRIGGADALEAIEHISRHGFVAALRDAAGDVHAIVVLRRGDRPAVHRLVESLATDDPTVGADSGPKPGLEGKAGRELHPLAQDNVWWTENGDLFVASNSMVAEVEAVREGRKQIRG